MLLALAVEALVVLLLLFLVPAVPGKKEASRTIVFGIDAPASDDSEKAENKYAKAPARPRVAAKPQPASPKPRETPPPVEPPPDSIVPGFLRLTRSEYAASDIAKMRSAPPAPAAATASNEADGGPRPGDSELVAAKGPHGEPLYAAEWYVRPTHAQLNTYLSDRARSSGWGLIACRTVARYHVEDCQELAESPRGSGLAGSVRQAAWQFLVRPPRIGGKSMVGEWVAIRIDYTITQR